MQAAANRLDAMIERALNVEMCLYTKRKCLTNEANIFSDVAQYNEER